MKEVLPEDSRIFPYIDLEILPRQYLTKLIGEINLSYQHECFTGGMILMRKLIETLLIDCYLKDENREAIQVDGRYISLKALIGKFQSDYSIEHKNAEYYNRIRDYANPSAHQAEFFSSKSDFDHLRPKLKSVLADLIAKAYS